jgi:hypothetical protein
VYPVCHSKIEWNSFQQNVFPTPRFVAISAYKLKEKGSNAGMHSFLFNQEMQSICGRVKGKKRKTTMLTFVENLI